MTMSCLVRIFKFNQLYMWGFSLPWLCSAWWGLSTKNWGSMFWKMFFGLKRPLKVACYWTELEILQRGLLRKLASDGKEEMDLLNFSLIWREGEKGNLPDPLCMGGRQGMLCGEGSWRGEISWVRRFFDVDMAFDYKEWSLSWSPFTEMAPHWRVVNFSN